MLDVDAYGGATDRPPMVRRALRDIFAEAWLLTDAWHGRC